MPALAANPASCAAIRMNFFCLGEVLGTMPCLIALERLLQRCSSGLFFFPARRRAFFGPELLSSDLDEAVRSADGAEGGL